MKKVISLVTLFFLSAITTHAQKSIEFTEYDLDNGLHVILHEDHSTPNVAVTILYHVGSKNEQSDRTGFAHFFEHLMFEGSKYVERGKFDKYVTNAGGVNNASTSFDRTFYYILLPSNELELGLWLESERLLHLKIDSIGVETQRKVVKEEKKQRIDNQPYGSILEETFKHAFTVHPYKWVPIGSAQYIDKANIDEFIEFHDKFYVPENATLSIAGDIDIEDTKDLIEKYFSEIPRSGKEIPRPTVVEPTKTEEVRDTVYDNIQLPLVLQAYHIPAQGTDDYYALKMLTTLLSSGKSSRLYKELVDNQQLALQASSFPLALEDPGLFLTFSICNANVDAAKLDAAVDVELAKVRESLISDVELEKIQNQVENDFVSQNSSVAGIAETLADYHVYFGNTNLINTEIDKFMAVTKEDIKRVANKYLTKENRVVLYYLPKSLKK